MSWLPVVVTVEPASEPITLAQVKEQARVDGSDNDSLLTSYITAARLYVELYTGTKLVEQTVSLKCSRWCDLADLPIAPVQSITSISYLDADGIEQTLATNVYEAVTDGLEPSIRLGVNKAWPTARCVPDAIRVTAVVGYQAVPTTIAQAILLLISAWNDSRDLGSIPDGVPALLSNHRRF